MKLLFLMDNAKGIGGGDYSIFKFAEYLAKIGNKVKVFASKENEFYKNYELPKNLSITYRSVVPYLFKGCGRVDLFWDKIFTKIFIENYIKKNKNIDFIAGYQTSSAIKATKLGKKYGLKVINFVFESPTWLEKQLGDKWTNDLKKPRYKKLWDDFEDSLKHCDIIFVNSNITNKETKIWLKSKVDATIYPGIDFDIVKNIPEQKKENQIIYIGRLHKYKNVDEIVKSLAKIKSPPKLAICGDGPEKEKLMQLASKLKINCVFKGQLTDYEKWAEIKKSKFMVFPSSMEGFGMPPMEALYCGVPCICSDLPVFREVYKNKVEYFKEHNINDLKRKILFLLENTNYCIKRGKEGKRYIENRFSWLKSARKIEKIIKLK